MIIARSEKRNCIHITKQDPLLYRHLISAPVDWTSTSDRLYKHPWLISQKNKPKRINNTRTCSLQIKLRSVVSPSMYPCPVNDVVIGRAVVYYVRPVHAFSTILICRHCSRCEMCQCHFRECTMRVICADILTTNAFTCVCVFLLSPSNILALMAESNVLPVTAQCPSSLPTFGSQLGQVGKLSVTRGHDGFL